MSNNEDTGPIEEPSWESAGKVWASYGVNLLDTVVGEQAYWLIDLRSAAAAFNGAKSATETDRHRDWSTDQLADQSETCTTPCRGLTI